MQVFPINPVDCKDYIVNVHYAHRMPPIEVAFGMYVDKVLRGVCTFSTPASRFAIRPEPYELNRLVIDEGMPKNTLSRFLSICLKKFPHNPAIIVSYADPNYGHQGYIYQATNWIYNGLSNGRKTFYINDVELHERTIYDKYGTTSVPALQEMGLDVRTEANLPKHRYFYLIGDKRFKKSVEIESFSYPKGDNKRYELKRSNPQMILF